MKSEIKYVELKSGFSHNGPAWIGFVFFSKSGKTLYFDGKAFQKIGSERMRGNFFDIDSGEEYWISGVKKNQQDRHCYGGGKVFVENRVLADYLRIIEQVVLNSKGYELTEVEEKLPILRINKMENQKGELESAMDDRKRFLKAKEMSVDELSYFIEYYKEDSINGRFLKGRKNSRNRMNELAVELEFRKQKNNL